MRILALEPYYGGSHQSFIDGWSQRSRHEWCLLTLPPYKWKWRMRHAAITFAEQVTGRVHRNEQWDLVLCSDMMNLAEFIALSPAAVCDLPRVVYFHENQLTYPVRVESERDYHFVFTNLVTALAARQVWFNSEYHRTTFLKALPGFLKRMPDYQPLGAVERIHEASRICPPGIESFAARDERPAGPLRILWAARWEHDKNPELFFEALTRLQAGRLEFRLSVIGEQFREAPEVFAWAQNHFAGCIDYWGYQPSREAYVQVLAAADVVVSTAEHEFFGISVAEAVAAGAVPVLPRRLAYPEIFDNDEFFYDGSVEDLAAHLIDLIRVGVTCADFTQLRTRAARCVAPFQWSTLVPRYDDALETTIT